MDVVSAGGTGTFDTTGANACVTELQAGSYAFMDTSHAAIVPGFDFALTILATVISRHGRTTILDCGKKSIGLEAPAPRLLDHVSTVQYVAEEHTVLELGDAARLTVGDRVEVVPSYCPVAVNLHDVYFVVDEGIVVDVWPDSGARRRVDLGRLTEELCPRRLQRTARSHRAQRPSAVRRGIARL